MQVASRSRMLQRTLYLPCATEKEGTQNTFGEQSLLAGNVFPRACMAILFPEAH
jgi:hypothetical protein